MLNDFELIVKRFDNNPDITIIPLADVHLGSRECMEKKFADFCELVSKTPDVYLVILGDLLDNCTRNSIANPFQIGYTPSEARAVMVKYLEPIKDRILALTAGNHEKRKDSEAADYEPLYEIACRLGIENLYRPNMAFIKIQMGDRKKCKLSGALNPTYTLCVTHGAGGGASYGAPLSKSVNYSYSIDNLDCFILGHFHKPFSAQPCKIVIDTHNNKVTFKPFKVICATSWLEYGGYAASKMLVPASHSLQKIHLNGTKKEITITM